MNAQTGNNMIPSNPGIAQQQVRDGVQQISPQYSGAAPIQQQQAPEQQQAPVESYDFWTSVEERITPQDEITSPAQQPQQPQAQPDERGQPQQPPQQQPESSGLTPEQQAAIYEAQGYGQPQPQQQWQQPVQQQPAPQQQPLPQAFEQQTIDRLATTEYAMPDDVAQRMVSEPEKVYPQLAARLHVRLATQIGQAVQNMLPAVVDQMVDQRMRAVRMETEFYRQFPQLSDPRFSPVVSQALRVVRQANPNASATQVMTDGAALAAYKLRLNMQQPQQQQPQRQQQPPPVSYQPPQQNGQQYYPQPFIPMQGGGAGLPMNSQVQPQNEFEALAMDPNW